jgi:hypothetical protein
MPGFKNFKLIWILQEMEHLVTMSLNYLMALSAHISISMSLLKN